MVTCLLIEPANLGLTENLAMEQFTQIHTCPVNHLKQTGVSNRMFAIAEIFPVEMNLSGCVRV